MRAALAFILAATAAALPAIERQVADRTIRFSGFSIRSGSPIQYASINANGSEFWLNKDTSTYCPEVVGDGCPTGAPQTVFSKDLATSTLYLDVFVPGGQQVYVASDGLLKFTVAHSRNTGVGSFVEGFQIAQAHLFFENEEWLACPKEDAYEVYAASRVSGGDERECLGFRFLAGQVADDVESAWEYV